MYQKIYFNFSNRKDIWEGFESFFVQTFGSYETL